MYTLELLDVPAGQVLVQRYADGTEMYAVILPEDWTTESPLTGEEI